MSNKHLLSRRGCSNDPMSTNMISNPGSILFSQCTCRTPYIVNSSGQCTCPSIINAHDTASGNVGCTCGPGYLGYPTPGLIPTTPFTGAYPCGLIGYGPTTCNYSVWNTPLSHSEPNGAKLHSANSPSKLFDGDLCSGMMLTPVSTGGTVYFRIDLGAIYFIQNVSFVPGIGCSNTNYPYDNGMQIGFGVLADGSDVSYIYNLGTVSPSFPAGTFITTPAFNTQARYIYLTQTPPHTSISCCLS